MKMITIALQMFVSHPLSFSLSLSGCGISVTVYARLSVFKVFTRQNVCMCAVILGIEISLTFLISEHSTVYRFGFPIVVA